MRPAPSPPAGLCIAGAAILAAMLPAPVHAQTPAGTRAMAEELAREGKRLLERGQLGEACDKLASSYKLDDALNTLINLAACHEKQGKLATAWREFNDVLTLGRKEGQAARQKLAQDHAAALEPRLPRLAVRVEGDGSIEGLEITLDHVALARGAWGTPMPVDPGEHVVEATAPGRERWEARASLKAGESRSVAVPRLVEPTVAAPPPPPPPKWKLPVGLAGLGAGVVGIAMGAYFGVRAFNLASDSNAGCKPDGSCTAAGFDAFQRGKTAANLSNGFFAAGAALAAAGTVLVVLGATEPRAAAAIQIGPGTGLLSLRGSW